MNELSPHSIDTFIGGGSEENHSGRGTLTPEQVERAKAIMVQMETTPSTAPLSEEEQRLRALHANVSAEESAFASAPTVIGELPHEKAD